MAPLSTIEKASQSLEGKKVPLDDETINKLAKMLTEVRDRLTDERNMLSEISVLLGEPLSPDSDSVKSGETPGPAPSVEETATSLIRQLEGIREGRRASDQKNDIESGLSGEGQPPECPELISGKNSGGNCWERFKVGCNRATVLPGIIICFLYALFQLALYLGAYLYRDAQSANDNHEEQLP